MSDALAVARRYREEAAALRDEANGLRKAADDLDRRAQQKENLAKAIEDAESGLPLRVDSGTSESMGSTQINAESTQSRSGVPLASKGPVAKAAKILGISLAAVARAIKVNEHSLRTWDQRGRMPDAVKAKIQGLVDAHEQAEKAKKRGPK